MTKPVDSKKQTKITVFGAGVMGTALAVYLSRVTLQKNSVRLCGTTWDDAVVEMLREKRHCSRLKVNIPEHLPVFFYKDRKQAVEDADIVMMAVTSDGLQTAVEEMADYMGDRVIMASITKGIDGESLQTMAEMMECTLRHKGRGNIPVVKLGGPLRADELAHGFPAEGVFASRSLEAAFRVRDCFASTDFRSEISVDVVGVDLCASLKNAYAIAFGMVDGLYPGADNPKAALFGRITDEMRIFVAAYGGEASTVSGIAGCGDLYVTVQGGRNRTFGHLLGQGASIEEAMAKMRGQTIEGIASAIKGWEIAQFLEKKEKLVIDRDLPLLTQLYQVLQGKKTAAEAIKDYWKTKVDNPVEGTIQGGCSES